ncbi:Uncharacterised protein [Clostridium fallax]|uniref:Uncharacterized protein n=1 Tax=Clostridium fallax TaxID=1533 RepID=A0A1M4VVY9_9CLOT|nr:hypothetical protein SAMN05443638_10950 [Clostridium fallax]SQB07722.1 Uncharacterised protein [Clostridium fallax]
MYYLNIILIKIKIFIMFFILILKKGTLSNFDKVPLNILKLKIEYKNKLFIQFNYLYVICSQSRELSSSLTKLISILGCIVSS